MIIIFSLLIALVFMVVIECSIRIFGRKFEELIKGKWFLPIAVAPITLASLFLAKKLIETLGLN